MKKSLIILATILCGMTAAFAQKQVVAVNRFVNNGNMPNSYAEEVRSKVMEGLTATGRIEVIDATSIKASKVEQERRKQEMNMNDDRQISDVGALNANYLLEGSVNNYSCTKKQTKNSKGGYDIDYTVKFTYTLTLIDPSTSSTKANPTYEVMGFGDTDALAMQSAINNVGKKFKDFIEENFAATGTIVQVFKTSKDGSKAEQVYIDLGTNAGIAKGQKFDVYAVIDVAGEKANKLIGEIKTEEVTSASRSLCKVTKGGDLINKAMAAGEPISLKSKASHSFFEKVGL